MLLKDRIKSFDELGDHLKNLSNDVFEELAISARNENAWFTVESVKSAINGITKCLNKENLVNWISRYDLEKTSPKKIGIIAAGNIPMVGFHDVLSVLISGHQLMLKMSSEDRILMRYVLNQLSIIESSFEDEYTLVDRLNEADVYIATGSDNTARYFHYYFKDKPNLIRKNRSSVAVITGEESKEELKKLGKDIFQYYGLGCRNVSKVFLPKNYKSPTLLDCLQSYESTINHHKYQNNYDYNKSIYLVNQEAHLDNGFLLLRESEDLVSPISVLYYQSYESEEQLNELLEISKDKIQCIVGHSDDKVNFGEAQNPELWDYADGVDTLAFLASV